MNDTQIKTLEQIRQFLSGTLDVEFSIDSKDESYRWIERYSGPQIQDSSLSSTLEQ